MAASAARARHQSGAGDGKTTTSANLALTMAQDFNHSVVLVEADMRRPTLAGLCGIAPERGLVDVLIGGAAARRRAGAAARAEPVRAACRPGDKPVGRTARAHR